MDYELLTYEGLSPEYYQQNDIDRSIATNPDLEKIGKQVLEE